MPTLTPIYNIPHPPTHRYIYINEGDLSRLDWSLKLCITLKYYTSPLAHISKGTASSATPAMTMKVTPGLRLWSITML